jgi:uncharacterized membrane protein YebE (DUF533 family)
MNPNKLLEQFLGGDLKGKLGQAGSFANQNLGGFAGGAAAGGVLALLLGNKKVRKMAGGVVGYGGAAALGALALKAYQNWQQGRPASSAPVATQGDLQIADQRFRPDAMPAVGGEPFPLVLVRAMIGAAKADGHIDAEEHKQLFERVGQLGLDAEAKAYVFDALSKPVDLNTLAGAAQTEEQAAEIYLASRLAIDPDQPAEKSYLEALAHRLKLPAELVAHLDRQVEAAAS